MLDETKRKGIVLKCGGDPLFQYEKNLEWYRKLFKITYGYYNRHGFCSGSNMSIELHTTYLPDETVFPFYDCDKVLYYLNTIDQISKIVKTGHEAINIVFYVNKSYTVSDVMDITIAAELNGDIDGLYFYETNDSDNHVLEVLRLGNRKLWSYKTIIDLKHELESNVYYIENKICYFDDIKENKYNRGENNEI